MGKKSREKRQRLAMVHRQKSPAGPHGKLLNLAHRLQAARDWNGLYRVAEDKILVNRLKEVQVYHFHDTTDEAQIRNSQDLDAIFSCSVAGESGCLPLFHSTDQAAHY